MRLPDAEISGWVCIRPIRVGIVFKPTIEAVVAAVQHATGSWGGIYFPFIDPTDQDKALRQATALDVDVFVPIDDNPASIQLSNVDGYRWRGRAEWSPFGHGIGRLTRHVKGTDWIIDEDASQAKLFLPAWEDDALNGLYSVLYGKFGDDDHSRQQAAAFKRRARRIQIQSGDSWPPFWQTNTPISLTAREMTYTGDSGGNGVVVLDPQDPEQLCYFWNLRASGSNVVPWVVGDEARFATMVSAWLEDALELGYLSGWRRGDGRDAGPTAVIFKGDEQEMPVSLIDICDGLGISVIHADMRELSAGGWTGNHPFSTHFANTFNASLSRRGVFEIPLPRLGNARWHRGHQPGRVAADIRISSATNLPPDWVVLLPASRKLGPLLDRITETTEAFARPTVNGRAMDVLADSAMAILSPVRSMSALERLLAEPGWSVRQTDRGRFSMRLIQMLGGSDSYVANQPAIRAVLTTTAAAHDGRPMSALIQAANNYRGKWPGPLTPERAAQEYPLNAVRYLLQKKVLQPALPVRCPDCTCQSGDTS